MTNTTQRSRGSRRVHFSTWFLNVKSVVRASISAGPVVGQASHGTHVTAARKEKEERKAGKQDRPEIPSPFSDQPSVHMPAGDTSYSTHAREFYKSC